MKSRFAFPMVGILLVSCAPSVQRPTFFPGTGTHDLALDCAENVLVDDGFRIADRNEGVGVLSAEKGNNWLYVSVIPQEPLVHTIQVVATEGAQPSASDIALRCSTGTNIPQPTQASN